MNERQRVPGHPPLPAALDPFLPMLYLAWADGAMSEEELSWILGEMRARGTVDEATLSALEAWLDPAAPPSPDAVGRLRARIREVAPTLYGREEAEALFGSDEAEAIFGVLGEEVLRELRPAAGPADAASLPTPPAFDPGALRAFIDADQLALRDQVLRLLHEPELRIPPHLPKEEHRARVLAALLRLAREGLGTLAFPPEYGGGGNPRGAIAVFETLAYGDLSAMIKWGVQFGLWGGSVYQLGTRPHHERLLRQIGTLELPGCYAMTEISHGSNVRDLETTATWIPDAGEFEIHTPHAEAGKEWIGNAALHGKMATVFAQLRVGEASHGVHAFLVPLRSETGEPLPGIRIADCGWKVGLNGIDNGRIWFDRVRIPRENLLNRFAEVTPEGEYRSPIPGEGKRFFTMLGTLVTGRISIALGSLAVARTALTVGIRFSERRRQFGPAGGPERPILDYLTQQRALLPRLAATYAYTFATRDLVDRHAALLPDDEAGLAEVEGLAAGLKAVTSWHAMATVQAAREACGGQGYRSDNRLGQLRSDADIFTTFEGANPVLMQLLARGLLARFRRDTGDLRLWGMMRFLAERAGTRVTELNPVVTRRTDEAHLRDGEFHLAALRYREERLLISAARRLRALIAAGVDSFDAMNRVQDHLVELAQAHVDRVALEALQGATLRAPSEEIAEMLGELACLFGLERIEAHRAWHLEAGYLEPAKSRAIRALVNTLCTGLRPHARLLVDAFGIPDDLLGAPAALAPRGVVATSGEPAASTS